MLTQRSCDTKQGCCLWRLSIVYAFLLSILLLSYFHTLCFPAFHTPTFHTLPYLDCHYAITCLGANSTELIGLSYQSIHLARLCSRFTSDGVSTIVYSIVAISKHTVWHMLQVGISGIQNWLYHPVCNQFDKIHPIAESDAIFRVLCRV